MNAATLVRFGVLAVALAVFAPPSWAAPDEIQVYTGETDEPGEFGLELHVNQVLKGGKTPEFEGQMPDHHVLQVTPEFSYGVTKEWEAGMYVPFAMAPDGNLYNNGLRGRMKYIAEHAENSGFYWGFNTEVGYFSRRVSENHWGMELRPILGYDDGKWMAAFNPILDVSLSTNVSREPGFQPAFKLGRTVAEGIRAGFEYYGDFGPLHHPVPTDQRTHYLFGAVDINRGNLDLNVGIGKGFVAATDDWVVKAIIAFPFK